MKNETNLDKVKSVAKLFLHLDIDETQYSPAIVKHPFTDCGITAIKDETGEYQTINLLEEKALKRWRNVIEQMITESDSAYQIYMMITKPYAMVFLDHISENLSSEDFSTILSSAWIQSENPHCDPNFTRKKLLGLFKKAETRFLMDASEYEDYTNLDDMLTVYRGVTSYNAKNIKALSWTLDPKTAEWFAHRFGEEGTVYEAQIDRKYVYALFKGRNESEVIVDPRYLINITEKQDMNESMDENSCSIILQ